MGAWPDKSRTCAREAAVDQGTWQNFVLLKHLTFLHTYTRECRGCLRHYEHITIAFTWAYPSARTWALGVADTGAVFTCPRGKQQQRQEQGWGGKVWLYQAWHLGCLPPPPQRLAKLWPGGLLAAPVCSISAGWGGWESRASHHRFHGNTQHQSHAATPSGWLDIKGREWWQSWTHSDAATPTTGAMLLNHLHHPRAGYSRASATWASACVLSPPSPGHSRWGPLDWWTHCTERTAPFFVLTDQTCLSVMPDTSVSATPRATSFVKTSRVPHCFPTLTNSFTLIHLIFSISKNEKEISTQAHQTCFLSIQLHEWPMPMVAVKQRVVLS